jgi:hypothetical protein
LIVICHRQVSRRWSGMDLATLDTAMAHITALSKTDALSADMERQTIRAGRCEPISIACVGLVAAGFTESDRAVLLEEDVRWGARLSHVV